MNLTETEELDSVMRALASSPSVAPPPGKHIANRFVLRRKLGEGSFGAVYEAEDQLDGGRVALKLLRRVGGEWPDRFKREFRALRDLEHVNLISLYELFYLDDCWLFTMELLDGSDLLEHAREGVAASAGLRFDEKRVRSAFAQLASGLSALHAAGKVHRDVKPSNVLVTREGRLVLLDLGLVAEVAGYDWSRHQLVVGTPGYMAPEQAAMAAIGPPADMYAVGVMLYELLTGRLPYTSDPQRVLLEKLTVDAPSASGPDGMPADLVELTAELLARDPGARPTAAETFTRLTTREGGDRVRYPWGSAAPPPPTPSVRLVGRLAELDALESTLTSARGGIPALLHVKGASGIGKTALVGAFVDRLRDDGRALVFRARCYERESVPFAAFDDLVESLVRHLGQLAEPERADVLPEDFAPLERMFPVFRFVVGAPNDPQGEPSSEPKELRHRAFAALGQILARLGAASPLVLWFDDVQWADADSASLLESLLRGPRAPTFLTILSHRATEEGRSAFLETLDGLPADEVDRSEVVVRALAADQARELAGAMLGEDERASSCVDVVAGEADGNPFFIKEFASFLREHSFVLGGSATADVDVSLEKVILGRVRQLPESAQRLLEVVAIAGAPIARRAAFFAAELDADAHSALALLGACQLVRTGGAGAANFVATYHDRIGETVAASLEIALRETRHREIAEALERVGDADPETLVVHYRGAADFGRAAEHAVRAAEQAASALAFERAARLYRVALDLRRPTGDERQALEIALGDALANAGHGRQAADVYLDAARSADLATSIDLRRRAGEQLLRSGHVDEGFTIAESVLRAMGARPPADMRTALLSLVARRAFLAVRGYSFAPHAEGAIPVHDLERLDASWSASVAAGMIDTVRGAELQARHMVLALRVGEPYRVARALCLETAHTASQGHGARKAFQRLKDRTRRLADDVGRPHARGLSDLAEGMGEWFFGRPRVTVDLCTRAEEVFRRECTGAAWEIGTARIFAYSGLAFRGELAELRRRIDRHAREGRDRNDRYAAWIPISGYPVVAHLASDRPGEARDEIVDALRHWSKRAFTVQHHWASIARALVDLYTGDEHATLARLEAEARAHKAAQLLRVEMTRVNFRFVQIQCLLASAGSTGALNQIEPLVAAMADEKAPWVRPLAEMTAAGLASRRGRTKDCAEALRRAIAGLDALEMGLFAGVARRRLGQVIGGDEGRALVAQSEATMAAQGVVRPDRLTRALAAGYPAFD